MCSVSSKTYKRLLIGEKRGFFVMRRQEERIHRLEFNFSFKSSDPLLLNALNPSWIVLSASFAEPISLHRIRILEGRISSIPFGREGLHLVKSQRVDYFQRRVIHYATGRVSGITKNFHYSLFIFKIAVEEWLIQYRLQSIFHDLFEILKGIAVAFKLL